MKEQTFLLQKLDKGFLLTTSGKQYGTSSIMDSVTTIMQQLAEVLNEIDKNKDAESLEVTITHKLHIKSTEVEPNEEPKKFEIVNTA